MFHYATPGPVALRLDWNNISFTFSGKLNLDGSVVKSHISLMYLQRESNALSAGDTIPLQSFLDLGSGSDVVSLW